MRERNLILQFRDDFSKEYEPPDYFNLTRWTKWRGDIKAEDGYAIIRAITTQSPGPGVMAFGGFATREKRFNPELRGTNGLESSLVDYIHEGEFLNKWLDMYGRPSQVEDPTVGRYIMGWSLTIANYYGQIGCEKDNEKDRGVQVHLDWMSKRGLHIALVRNIVPGDFEKYPEWDPEKQTVDEIIEQGPFIARPCVALAVRRYPRGRGDNPVGHRYGLYLTDNGNTLYWTLDGNVMDTVDITGHFSSSPESVRDGAYVTIAAGGSYQNNVWKVDDVEIYISKL